MNVEGGGKKRGLRMKGRERGRSREKRQRWRVGSGRIEPGVEEGM